MNNPQELRDYYENLIKAHKKLSKRLEIFKLKNLDMQSNEYAKIVNEFNLVNVNINEFNNKFGKFIKKRKNSLGKFNIELFLNAGGDKPIKKNNETEDNDTNGEKDRKKGRKRGVKGMNNDMNENFNPNAFNEQRNMVSNFDGYKRQGPGENVNDVFGNNFYEKNIYPGMVTNPINNMNSRNLNENLPRGTTPKMKSDEEKGIKHPAIQNRMVMNFPANSPRPENMGRMNSPYMPNRQMINQKAMTNPYYNPHMNTPHVNNYQMNMPYNYQHMSPPFSNNQMFGRNEEGMNMNKNFPIYSPYVQNAHRSPMQQFPKKSPMNFQENFVNPNEVFDPNYIKNKQSAVMPDSNFPSSVKSSSMVFPKQFNKSPEENLPKENLKEETCQFLGTTTFCKLSDKEDDSEIQNKLEMILGDIKLKDETKMYIKETCDVLIENICYISCMFAKNRNKEYLEEDDIKLALKTEYNIEFPDSVFRKKTCESELTHEKRIALLEKEKKKKGRL